MDENFARWFCGFTDGEGCFSVGNTAACSGGLGVNIQFRIGLRVDDKKILEECRDALGGIGKISTYQQARNGDYDRPPMTHWRVSNAKELLVIVDFFEKYPLRSKKKNDYAIWKLAVAEYQNPPQVRDYELLHCLRQQCIDSKKLNVACNGE